MTEKNDHVPVVEQPTFIDMGLSEPILRALTDLNFVTPSPIQQKTIEPMMNGRHVVGLAQTGTGKTAAFALPILHRLNVHQRTPQALILAPTRELAIQVAEHIVAFSRYLSNVRVAVLCGGQDYRPQLKQLRDGAQIVVGTPGRVIDHLERGSLNLTGISTFVLDEADEMLRMGFIEDVETVLAKLPEEKQIALFSATMPSRIRQIANQYLHDPVSIEIRMETATVKSIEQRFLFASQHQKTDALLRILALNEHQGVIVFVRTKNSTEEVASLIQQHGHKAMAIHGDLTQSLRERIITQFKQGHIDVLVATDVAARGLDVERVTHVINYDMAHDCETYVHRIGRTGRAGRAGTTILFVLPKESRMLTIIERHTRQRIEKMAVPNNEMIQDARKTRFITQIKERISHENVDVYRDMIQAYVDESHDNPVDVAAALALMLNQDRAWNHVAASLPPVPKQAKESHSFNGDRFGGDRKNRPSALHTKSGRYEARKPSAGNRDKDGRELFRLEVGRMHGVKPGNIVGAIANEAGLQSRHITGLKIHDDHSTVQLPSGMTKEIVLGLTKTWVCGRQLKVTSLGQVSS